MTGRRRFGLLAFVALIALAIAIPAFVLAADPSASPAPPGQSKPDKSPKPGKGNERAKTPEVAVTVSCTAPSTLAIAVVAPRTALGQCAILPGGFAAAPAAGGGAAMATDPGADGLLSQPARASRTAGNRTACNLGVTSSVYT